MKLLINYAANKADFVNVFVFSRSGVIQGGYAAYWWGRGFALPE